MDLVRLGAPYSTEYVPDKLIENYTSLVWTERFTDFGEFEIKSFDIENMMNLLPENTLVSHLETDETMAVETHAIEWVGEGRDAQPELTIKGRSGLSILESRWFDAPYQKKRRLGVKYTASTAIAALMYNAVNNDTGYDLTREVPPMLNGTRFPWNTRDFIPNVIVTDSSTNAPPERWWQFEQGTIYSQIKKILEDRKLGIRLRRPITPNTVTRVYIMKEALPHFWRGTPTRTPWADVTALQFDVYSGVDRSSTVQLSQLLDHLEKPVYLKSNRGHKTLVEIMSGIDVNPVNRPGEGALSGWRRRTTGFNAGTPDIPDEPEKPAELKSNATKQEKEDRRKAMDKWIDDHAAWKNKRNAIIADFKDEARTEANRILKETQRVDMFAGDISPLAPYKYKRDYHLGDTVMLKGLYGDPQKMIVAEHVRSEDKDGDRGYTGLILP